MKASSGGGQGLPALLLWSWNSNQLPQPALASLISPCLILPSWPEASPVVSPDSRRFQGVWEQTFLHNREVAKHGGSWASVGLQLCVLFTHIVLLAGRVDFGYSVPAIFTRASSILILRSNSISARFWSKSIWGKGRIQGLTLPGTFKTQIWLLSVWNFSYFCTPFKLLRGKKMS